MRCCQNLSLIGEFEYHPRLGVLYGKPHCHFYWMYFESESSWYIMGWFCIVFMISWTLITQNSSSLLLTFTALFKNLPILLWMFQSSRAILENSIPFFIKNGRVKEFARVFVYGINLYSLKLFSLKCQNNFLIIINVFSIKSLSYHLRLIILIWRLISKIRNKIMKHRSVKTTCLSDFKVNL